MKLYTREQMIEAFKYGQNPKGFDWIGDMIDSLTPIQLPSDEEIELGMYKTLFISPNPEHKMFNAGTRAGFTNGAKWVIEQIKQQDKCGIQE